MKVSNIPIINQVLASATMTSSACSTQQVQKASFQISISSGAFTGTLQIQASNDAALGGQPLPLGKPDNWVVIGTTTTAPMVWTFADAVAGTSFIIEKPTEDLCYEYVRVVIVDTAGSGTHRGVFLVRMKTHSVE